MLILQERCEVRLPSSELSPRSKHADRSVEPSDS
jgi:hypothetical protein